MRKKYLNVTKVLVVGITGAFVRMMAILMPRDAWTAYSYGTSFVSRKKSTKKK